MDMHPTPFPATKSQSVRSKYKNITDPPKSKLKEHPPIQRQKRVFGTIRNPNIPAKPDALPEKTSKKQPIPRKQSKSVQNPEIIETPVVEIPPLESTQTAETQLVQETEIPVIQPESTGKTTEIPSIQVVEVSVIPSKESESTPDPLKKQPVENRVRTKKKSVCFTEPVVKENVSKKLQEKETDGIPRTPARSPFTLAKPRLSGTPSSLAKSRLSGTPYQSAEKCSHCRFDRLETSSYWLSQIRLAESVGKHFVSLAFFGLALDSKAEPYSTLRVELKKYLGRNEYLREETGWKDVSHKYGFVKDESKNQANVTDSSDGDILDQEEQSQEQIKEADICQSHSESN